MWCPKAHVTKSMPIHSLSTTYAAYCDWSQLPGCNHACTHAPLQSCPPGISVLVFKAHRDPIVPERPQVLSQLVVLLLGPFAPQELWNMSTGAGYGSISTGMSRWNGVVERWGFFICRAHWAGVLHACMECS